MSFGLLTLGKQSLQASQSALSVTGQNISNVNTEGYTRQRPIFVSRPDQGGVSVDQVDRVADAFLNRQIWTDSATFNSYDAYKDFANELDNLLASDVTSISKAMDDYFGALQTAVDDPVSLPNRELFIAQTEALVQRFNDLDANIRRQSDTINGRLESNVAAINTIANNIAELNAEIKLAKAAGNNHSELLDQRDLKLEELSEYVGFTTLEESGTGSISVYVGNGEPLVVSQRANRLTTIASPADSNQLNIAIEIGSSNSSDITRLISGGKIGGMLEYRETALNETLDELGRIALVFANAMNEQHQKGVDLDGVPGEAMFTDINSSQAITGRVLSYGDNVSNVRANAIINDVSKVQATEYELSFTDLDKFAIVRGSDNVRLTERDFNKTDPVPTSAAEVDEDGEYYFNIEQGEFTLRIDGVTVTLDADARLVTGDQFLIRPTRNAASEIESQLTNARQLALASPLATAEDAGNTGTGVVSVAISDIDYFDQSQAPNIETPSVLGGLVVTNNPPNTGTLGVTVTDPTRANNLSYPITLVHDAGAYRIVDSTGTDLTAAGGSPYTPVAGEIDLTADFGISIAVGGTPGANEISSIEYDPTSIAENSLTPPLNVTFLSQLQGIASTDYKVTTLPANLTADAGTSGLTFNAIDITDAEEVGTVSYPLTFTHTVGSDYQVTDSGGNALFTATLSAGEFDLSSEIGLSIAVTGAAGAGAFTIGPADANQIEYTPVFSASTGLPSGAGSIEARVTNPSLASAASYPLTVTYDSTGPDVYTVSDSSGTPIFSGDPSSIDLAALGLSLDVSGAPVVGDTFTIEPDTNLNTGSAQINNIRATDDRLLGEVNYPLTVIYDAASLEYTISDSEDPANVLFRGPTDAAGTLDLTQTYGFAVDLDPLQTPDDGDTFTIQHDPDTVDASYVVLTDADGERVMKEYQSGEPITLSGYEVTVSNQPRVGDLFAVNYNTDGVSDNRNALFMSDLQFAKTVEGASFQDKYGQTVERVGTEAAVAQVNSQAGKAVLDANKQQLSSISGVNLDEEAAKLVQFQQAYQASAQLIRAAQTIFDTLLQSV